jgi:amidase
MRLVEKAELRRQASQGADGLPVGVHFAGRYGEEATLLALAAELERAQPWFDRVTAL